MTNEIKLTEAQAQELEAANADAFGVFRGTRLSTFSALEKHGFATRADSAWQITDAGRQWLQDAGYLDTGGGGEVPNGGNALDEPVSTLATVQATYISAKEKLEMYMAADPELAKLRDAASDAKNAVDMARQRVITKALETFAANPDERQVHPNVEIKMMTVLEYDTQMAISWSFEYAPRLVKLDAKGFETLMKARLEEDMPDFITRTKQPKPHIDRDLNGNS